MQFKAIYISLLLISIGLFSLQASGQTAEACMKSDTLSVMIDRDSCRVVLEQAVRNKGYWADILGRDTTLLFHFKQERKRQHFTVFISEVENYPQPFTYKLRVFYSPVIRKEEIDSQLRGLGYAYYLIRLNGDPRPNERMIDEVKFFGIEM